MPKRVLLPPRKETRFKISSKPVSKPHHLSVSSWEHFADALVEAFWQGDVIRQYSGAANRLIMYIIPVSRCDPPTHTAYYTFEKKLKQKKTAKPKHHRPRREAEQPGRRQRSGRLGRAGPESAHWPDEAVHEGAVQIPSLRAGRRRGRRRGHARKQLRRRQPKG